MAKGVKARRRVRSGVALRAVIAGALLLIAFFYYRPLRAYVSARHELAQRQAEVDALAAQHAKLERRLAASTSTQELVKEARRLGLVRPGERLFIVKGIGAWRKAQRAPARSIDPGGAGP